MTVLIWRLSLLLTWLPGLPRYSPPCWLYWGSLLPDLGKHFLHVTELCVPVKLRNYFRHVQNILYRTTIYERRRENRGCDWEGCFTLSHLCIEFLNLGFCLFQLQSTLRALRTPRYYGQNPALPLAKAIEV